MRSHEAAFLELGRVIRHLFHQLRAVAEAVTPVQDGFTASHRAVMESLANHGPETVPALARARPVARQHIQVLVNELLELGFVETRPNPAHKRSPLIALTKSGEARFKAIRRAESDALAAMEFSLSKARMSELSRDLQRLSEDLARWLERPSA